MYKLNLNKVWLIFFILWAILVFLYFKGAINSKNSTSSITSVPEGGIFDVRLIRVTTTDVFMQLELQFYNPSQFEGTLEKLYLEFYYEDPFSGELLSKYPDISFQDNWIYLGFFDTNNIDISAKGTLNPRLRKNKLILNKQSFTSIQVSGLLTEQGASSHLRESIFPRYPGIKEKIVGSASIKINNESFEIPLDANLKVTPG